MAKEKKGGPPGKKITLALAKKCLKLTVDGNCKLDLSNMGITTFPKVILDLANVEILDLSRNRLKEIPDCIGKFLLLRGLDLHSNYIEQVPPVIGQLKELRKLNLSNNRLRQASLPDELGHLTNLVSLNLGLNQFDRLPQWISTVTSLTEIGLHDNHFTSMPKVIRELPNLGKINIERNPIAPADGEGREEEKSTEVKHLFLVRGDKLCKSCQHKCKDERDRLEARTKSELEEEDTSSQT